MEIQKKPLDELISAVRDVWNFELDGELKATEAVEISIKRFPNNWMPVLDLLHSILTAERGFKPDATNEDIYKVLELLGWEVKE